MLLLQQLSGSASNRLLPCVNMPGRRNIASTGTNAHGGELLFYVRLSYIFMQSTMDEILISGGRFRAVLLKWSCVHVLMAIARIYERCFDISGLWKNYAKVARVRIYGFSEREVAVARAKEMVTLKSWYLQRDKLQSTEWRDTYVKVRLPRCAWYYRRCISCRKGYNFGENLRWISELLHSYEIAFAPINFLKNIAVHRRWIFSGKIV